MIRPAKPDDSAAVIAIAVATGMFPADDTEVVVNMLANYFGDNRADGQMCVIDEEGETLGISYYQPALAAERTWYLTMIAVHPAYQGKGRGAALLQYVETELRTKGQRLLLVETSGLPSYERTRAFYAKCGYTEEGRIRDFYEQGDDMVVFRKVLKVD